MTKANTLLFFLLIIVPITCFAQEKSILNYKEIAMGKSADGNNIMFHYIPVDGELKDFFYTDSLHYIGISDAKGNHLYNTETLKYIGDLKYGNKSFSQINNDGYIAVSTGGMFSFSYGKPTFYDFNNNKIWSSKNEVLLCDRFSNVVICTKDRKGEELIAYDMSTGKELWQKEIPFNRHYPWGHFYRDNHDKHNLYLMANSLVRLNVLTGDTVCHEFTAGVKEPLKSVFSFVKRNKTVGSQFFDELLFSDVTGATLTGTHSNILFSGDSLYVADVNNIYCLNKDLKTLWKVALPEGIGSNSHINIRGNKLYIQNYGVAFQRGLIARYGKPFIASYDKSNGRQISFCTPNIEQKLTGGILADGRAYWHADKALFYSDEGDSTIHKISWHPKTLNTPDEYYSNYVMCDTIGIVKDGQLIYIPTNKDQVIMEVYGKDFNIVKTDGSCDKLSSNEVYYNKRGNLYWTNNGKDHYNHFIIVDPKTHKVMSSFHINGMVRRDDSGNIFIITKQGIGFHLSKSNTILF